MFSLLCPSKKEQFAWTDEQKPTSLTTFRDDPFNYLNVNHLNNVRWASFLPHTG